MIQRIIFLGSLLLVFNGTSFGQEGARIPFKLISGYYFKTVNHPSSWLRNKITTREEMDSFFGMAAVMGSKGKPTHIDFKKNFVIAVVINEADRQMELSPIDLTMEKEHLLQFHFKMVLGEKMSSLSRSILLIAVDKKFNDTDIKILRTSCSK
jgi:hypothetical protein